MTQREPETPTTAPDGALHRTTEGSPGGTRAWVLTGPTSGIGRRAAHELARHGTVVLVGRDPTGLEEVAAEVRSRGGRAHPVVCDLSDIASARRAAAEIVDLDLRLAGLLNNAGVMAMSDATTPEGWDPTYTTNHLGPFALTEALLPHLPDGSHVVFVCSAVEDPERRIAVAAGFRGGRYLSAEASARGKWRPGGSSRPGMDAYATSKQGNLATVFALARAVPRLRFSGIEPGLNPGTGLSRDAGPAVRFVSRHLVAPLAPVIPHASTPRRSAALLVRVLTDDAAATGGYYDERGRPLLASAEVRDPAFSDRVVAETRALLATVPGPAAE